MAKQASNEMTTVEKLKRSTRYKNLKTALTDDLKAAGMNRLPYTDMVEQYMDLWLQLQLLNEDVIQRGVQIPYRNGSNQEGVTDNKSVNIAIRVGARMDNILTSLGYKERAKRQTAMTPDAGGEDDEL